MPTSKDKVINIVGKAEGWQDAPHEGEVWGVNDLIRRRPVSRVIDIHRYSDDFLINEVRRKAKKSNAQFIDYDNYPIDDVIAYFGADFFTSGIDYMLALAIYESATEINLYGVALAYGGEYEYQRPSVHFWIGQAMGRGIKVRIMGKESTILKINSGLMYGYDIPQKIDRSK